MGQGKREAEILVLDAGNTTIKLALANREKILESFTLPSRFAETEDSLGLQIWALICRKNGKDFSLKACVVSSVVPWLDSLLENALTRYLDCPVLFIPRDLSIPLVNAYPDSAQTGSDRLVGAYQARFLFPKEPSLLIVDFGTAVTFDCVRENIFQGGLIFPGPGIAIQALADKTAKLPRINLDFFSQEPRISVNTATSIKDGIVFGYKYLAEGLCKKLSQSLPAPVKTVATGSFALLLQKISDIFDCVVPSLALDGLRNLYYTQVSASADGC